jgi:hypothetical protein
LVDALLDQGKLIEIDGHLTNARAEKELGFRSNRVENSRRAANSRWSKQKGKSEEKQWAKNAPAMRPHSSGICKPEPEPEPEEDRESCSNVCWTRDSKNSPTSADDLERVPFPPRPPPPGADPGSARTPSSDETARAVALVSAAKEGFKSAGLALNPTPSSKELGAARSWDQAGADPDLTRMVAERIGAKFVARGEPVAPSLAYLNNPISEALTAPLASVGASRHEPNRPPVDRHLARTREALDAIDAIGARRMEAERGASRRTDPG